MVRFEKVKKVYPDGTVAVDDLSLEIAQGELVSFIGPSGCGKTTTLKMVNRLIPYSAGKIFVEGREITAIDPVKLRRRIGYVVQDISLMPHMTVAENIATVPKLLKWEAGRIKRRVDELLEMAGLPPELYRYRLPDQLSGGQKQRIGVLRALAADPQVVLMDEPFGALDPIGRERLQDELLDLQQKVRKTIIFVTHDMDEALKMSDRIVIMRRGLIEQVGTPDELQEHPANEFVRNFLGSDRLSAISPDAAVDILVTEPGMKADPDEPALDVLNRLESIGRETAQLVDAEGKWRGTTTLPLLKRASESNASAGSNAILERKLFIEKATIRDAAEILSDADYPVPVLNENGRFLGVVTLGGMARLTISRLRRRLAAKEAAC